MANKTNSLAHTKGLTPRKYTGAKPRQFYFRAEGTVAPVLLQY